MQSRASSGAASRSLFDHRMLSFHVVEQLGSNPVVAPCPAKLTGPEETLPINPLP
jgi:hypothetical protein